MGTRTRMRHWERWGLVALVGLAFALRLVGLQAVPPGWRDDELINIHALSGDILAGRFPLYFTGASGHEPLYHYLHAGIHAILGFNVLSGHLLSVVSGTLSVLLTYLLARRLYGRFVATVGAVALACSFWSLVYSRTAIRHIMLLPFALTAFYLLWRALEAETKTDGPIAIRLWVGAGIALGLALYIYYAARLLPIVWGLFGGYLALCHRPSFRRHWRGMTWALVVAVVMVAPMAVAIVRGWSTAAAQGIGADARLIELAVPLRELRNGNLRPLLSYTWQTMGMFHTTGDPEWLYNLAGRPVFNILGGALMWIGVVLALWRWRRPRYAFLVLWWIVGLMPAFISTPPASLGHTILAQPASYILPALPLAEMAGIARRVRGRTAPLALLEVKGVIVGLTVLFLVVNAARDLWDYFLVWPRQPMVRLLYRADYRQIARYLDATPTVSDVVVGSGLMGPWDRLALAVDTHRDDLAIRLFDPRRALVWPDNGEGEGDSAAPILLTQWPEPDPLVATWLEPAPLPGGSVPGGSVSGYIAIRPPTATITIAITTPITGEYEYRFANGLTLTALRWVDGADPAPGETATLWTLWQVAAPLDLPPIPIVANPPPPGVYNGPRLAVFTHLLAADGQMVAGDDGLWVDPTTLRPGDAFLQLHRLAVPDDAPSGPYSLEVGLYDPLTSQRWTLVGVDGQTGADRVRFPK